MRGEACIGFNGNASNFIICKIGMGEKVGSILGMCEIITIARGRNFKSKDIVEVSKILHLKLLTKEVFKLLNTWKIISR
jgi:sulfopyruvate decarboxylase TPP-binding subunit